MRKTILIIIAVVIILAILIFIMRSPKGDTKDDWIKDERGVWIKHGASFEMPDYVKEQQEVIDAALDLYNQKKTEGMQFSSQCLGTFKDYAIDTVHVPRKEIDNLAENQCQEFREGKVNHFIELDKNGNIARIE